MGWRDRLDEILFNRNQGTDQVLVDLAELMPAIQHELWRQLDNQVSDVTLGPPSPGLSQGDPGLD